MSKNEITFNDAQAIMNHLVHEIIIQVEINDLNLTKCWESSNAIQRFCHAKFNACPLKTTGLGFKYLTHCFDIISISPEYSFIIDLTYKQFDTNKYPLGIIEGKEVYIDGPAKFLSKKNKKELEFFGYIPYTKENLMDYLYSFIKPYKTIFMIDESFILEETLGTISDYGISLCDIENFEYGTDINLDQNQK